MTGQSEQPATHGERYTVIELVRGPNWTPGASPHLIVTQLRHMRTLWRLRQRGLILIAGPVPGMAPVQGLIVVHERDVPVTLRALEKDEAIRIGRLVARVAERWTDADAEATMADRRRPRSSADRARPS